jgi:pimeloyl-ACP methyl ester carboxylesterase
MIMAAAVPAFTTLAGPAPLHFVMLPGLVPDGPETFLRQRALFHRHGTVTIGTWPYHDFDLDAVVAAIEARLRAILAAGEVPVLVGVSVGGGICLELLRRCRERGEAPPVAALALLSPLTCTADLAPTLQRLLAPIAEAHARDHQEGAELHLERGRQFFKSLAARSVPGTPPAGLARLISLLTPSGLVAWQERRIRARIERTLDTLPARGSLARVVAMLRLPGILAGDKVRRPLAEVPTLILWGSKERHTLDMDGPGTALLCRPDLAHRVFPQAEVHWLYARDGEPVPHASLLKHYREFNVHLARFIARVEAAHVGLRLPFLPRTRRSA